MPMSGNTGQNYRQALPETAKAGSSVFQARATDNDRVVSVTFLK